MIKMLKPVFYKRDYTLNSFQAPWLAVKSATWDEIGGCDTADVAGWNLNRVDLAAALALLRCGVELVDESEIPCWWGYVEKIELYNGKTGAVCSLDEITNRVKVDYIMIDYEGLDYRGGDQRVFYGWAENTRSQELYGIKEKIIRAQEMTLATATARAGVELAEHAWPIARPAVRSTFEQGDLFITLKGWWHTAAWRYYNQAAGIIENYVLDSGAIQNLGNGAVNTKLAQSFTVGAVGWKLAKVWAQISKIAAPSDNMICSLYSDSAGLPDAELDSTDISNEEISKGYGWVNFNFSSDLLAANTTYWIILQRSGALDPDNFYRVKIDEDLKFAGGALKIYNGGGWVDRSPDADLVFRASGLLQTTDQINLMAGSSFGGQFLSGVSIEKASGIDSNPFRRGERTAQAEIIDLIKAGDSDAGRLLCEVTRLRVLRVFSAPAKSTASLRVSVDGYLCDEHCYPLPVWAPAAGQWAILENPWLGGGSPDNEISDRFYIKRVEYDVKSGFLRPARGVW